MFMLPCDWFSMLLMLGGLVGVSLGMIIISGLAVLKGKEHMDALADLLKRADALRLLSVGCIVFAAAMLALAGKFDNPVATVFSGIAGYVLGTARLPGRREMRDRVEPPHSA